MTLDELVEVIEKGKAARQKSLGRSGASQDNILKYRKMINDRKYMNDAIEKIADDFADDFVAQYTTGGE